MNPFLKQAYDFGARKALEELGVLEPETGWGDVAKSLGIGALGAGGTYAAMRKFRPAREAMLEALQKRVGDSYRVDLGAKQLEGWKGKLQKMLLGESMVTPEARGVVLRHTPNMTGPVPNTVEINAGNLADALQDKKVFHDLMSRGIGAGKGVEGSLPDTRTLAEALGALGGDARNLGKMFPEGYVIKPRTGSLSEGITRNVESRAGREALEHPDKFIIQPDLKPVAEYRVHTVEGVPFTATHRFLPEGRVKDLYGKVFGPGGGAFVPLAGKERSEVMDFLQGSTKHLNPGEGKSLSDVGESLHAAWDIVRTPKGQLKILEANPVPGTLMNPVASQKLRRMITGKWSPEASAIAGVGVGVPAAATAALSMDGVN